MNRKIMVAAVAVMFAVTSMMTGCETTGQAAGLGAGIGAVAGAVIGHQSGHGAEGAAIGAALGAGTGAAAHKIRAKRARNRAETVEQYNYQPSQGEMLTYEGSAVLPGTARPGSMVTSEVRYALLGAENGVSVNETRQLLRADGKVITEFSSKNLSRDDGTWVSEQDFRVPNDLQPGAYSVRSSVRTSQSSINGSTNFIIE